MRVELFTRDGCSLCEVALHALERVRAELPFDLALIDIDEDPAARELYRYDIPVVVVDGEKLFVHHVDEQALRRRLEEDGRGER